MRLASLKRMIRVLRLLFSTLLVAGLLAPAAHAQSEPEPGVTIDPDSPAAKEYALPVDSARKAAQGKATKKKSTDKKAPLFGEGVKPKSSSSKKSSTSTSSSSGSATSGSSSSSSAGSGSSGDDSTSSSTSKSSSDKKKSSTSDSAKTSGDDAQPGTTTDDQATTATAPGSGDPPAPAPQEVAQIAAQANQPTSGGGVGTALIIGAIGLAVLLAGGLAGLAMRRRGPGPGAGA
ncbi:MAG: hypothetical protein QOD81_78 [Solirubrobacteraceae bacterium]|nr:hypothetical protein [Solirubrobacteraceae bacterium]